MLRDMEKQGPGQYQQRSQGVTVAPSLEDLGIEKMQSSRWQRAMVAARMATMVRGARTDLAQICAMSQEEAAALVGVSERSLQKAKKVQAEAVAELTEAGGCRTGRRRKCWALATKPSARTVLTRSCQMTAQRRYKPTSPLTRTWHLCPTSPVPPATL
jgi:hypothetical protein